MTEEKIKESRQTHRATIGVAHQLSTIQDTATILVLGDGRIVEQAGHEKRLGIGGYYAALCEEQTIRSPMRDWQMKHVMEGASSSGY